MLQGFSWLLHYWVSPPHALEQADEVSVLSTVLFDIVLFFSLKKMVVWWYCHNMEGEVHAAAGSMILIGDSIHNFVDSVVIAASSPFSIPLCIITGVSMIAHDILRETGDFDSLLNTGYRKTPVLALNTVSSLSTVPSAIMAYFALEAAEGLVPYIMSLLPPVFSTSHWQAYHQRYHHHTIMTSCPPVRASPGRHCHNPPAAVDSFRIEPPIDPERIFISSRT